MFYWQCCSADKEDDSAEFAQQAPIGADMVAWDAPHRCSSGGEELASDFSEFTVPIQKSKGSIVGLELDGIKFAQVCAVLPDGVIESYNATAPPTQRVRAGDFIVAVDGVAVGLRQLIERLQGDTSIELHVLRQVPFRVALRQSPGEMLSSVKYATTGVSLIVFRTSAPITSYNLLNPERALKNHDCIMSVNGVSSSTTLMMEQLASASELDLLVARPTNGLRLPP